MPTTIRYHAQRKHIIQSFGRVREFDGRRSLSFWFILVLLVNIGGVWTHATSGAGDPGEKTLVLDFVGMGHRPTKLQLLLLDVTIVFFQGLLATISYETSLSATMPEDIPDPLLPEPEPSEVIFESYDPTLPLTYPPYPSPFPYPNNSNATINASSSYTRLPSESLDTLSKPNRQQTLPPPAPVIDVRFRHIIRRLTSPIPVPPTPTNSESESDNALSAMQLPLPATTSIQLATIFNVLSRAAAARRRETEERSPRGSQPTSNRRNAESISNGQVRSGRSGRRDNERRGGRRHNTTTIGSIYSPGTSRREEPMPRNVEGEGTMPGSIGDNAS